MGIQNASANGEHHREDTVNYSRTSLSRDIASTKQSTPDHCAKDVPDGGYGWVVVLCAFCINFLVDGIVLSFGVLLPEFVDYFNEKKSNIALVGTVLSGILLSSGPFIGVVINRFGCRPPIIVGTIVAAIALLSASFSPNVNVLIVTYGIIGGIGLGLMYLPVFVCAGEYFNKKRPIASGIAICGSGIGSIAYPPLIEYLVNLYDWRKTLWIFAGMTLVGGFVFGLLVRPFKADKSTASKVFPVGNKTIENGISRPKIKTITNGHLSNATNSTQNLDDQAINHENQLNEHYHDYDERKTNKNCKVPDPKDGNDTKETNKVIEFAKDYFGLFKNLAFLFVVIGNVFSSMAYWIPFIYIVDRALLLGISSKKAAFLLSIIGIVNTVSRIGCGVVLSLFRIKPSTLSIIVLFVGSVAGFLQQFCNEYGLLVLYCILFGLSCVFVSNAPNIVCDVLGVSKLANGMGLVLFAWGIGAVSGPYIAGLVFEATNNYNASFYLSGGSYMFAAVTHIISRIISRKSRKDTEITISPTSGNE